MELFGASFFCYQLIQKNVTGSTQAFTTINKDWIVGHKYIVCNEKALKKIMKQGRLCCSNLKKKQENFNTL